MAVAKITIKGKYQDGLDIKSATIATLTNVQISEDPESDVSFANVANEAATLTAYTQDCVSATVTGYTITFDDTDREESWGTPGDELKSEEIFSEDFSDTEVVPTLQIVNQNAMAKTKNFNFKFMADPVDTANFDVKATRLAEQIGAFMFSTGGAYDTFVGGNMTFTAKDNVVTPS